MLRQPVDPSQVFQVFGSTGRLILSAVSQASSLVIDNDEFQDHVLKCVYFTATPRNVWKGVQMLPDKDGNPGQCGRILFNYPLIHAVRDSVCRNFEVLIMLHEQQIDSAGSSNPAAAASDNSQQQKSNRQHTEAPDTRRYRKRSGDDNADDNADDDDVSNDADEPNLAISSSSSRSVLMADDEDFESDIEGYAMIELGMDDDDQVMSPLCRYSNCQLCGLGLWSLS